MQNYLFQVLFFCLGLTLARPNESSNSSSLSREKRAPFWSWVKETANKVSFTKNIIFKPKTSKINLKSQTNFIYKLKAV